MRSDRIFCWEALDVTDPLVRAAERLYEATQHPDERIPWGWIARSVKGRSQWRPGSWGKHLVLATPGTADPTGVAGADWKPDSTDPSAAEKLAGFAYGAHLPGFGGYVCYVGVDDRFRRRGVGTRLFDLAFKLFAADATASDESLPFVVWESRRPTALDGETAWKLWDARVALFDRVGGLWLDGVELLTPNYGSADGPPVPLQLFVKPIDRRAFDADSLTGIAAGLLERVYRTRPGDPLYDQTVAPRGVPRLRPATDAARRKALAAV